MNIYEIIGYIGTAFVLVSFLMTSVVKLRIINMIGSVISVIYGVLIKAYPTVVMNVALIIINAYQLYRFSKNTNDYCVLDLNKDDSYYPFFLKQYGNDILQFFPSYQDHDDVNYIKAVFHEGKTAGIIIGKRENDQLTVYADYATAEYRDCSVGQYLYPCIEKDNVKMVVLNDPVNNHDQYLLKMGFVNTNGEYRKAL